jgi:hypothetical protein
MKRARSSIVLRSASLALALALPAVVSAQPAAPTPGSAGTPPPKTETGLPILLNLTVGGNRAVIGLDAGALPLAVDAELVLDFDAAQNLCADSLGVSATVVNPLDPAFVARLPEGTLLPLALPVVIRVEPPTTSLCGALSFTDTVRAEIHTHLLPYTADSPLRLYKAPLGGRFYDITDAVAPGSVRTGGRTGGFSEFIIVVDLADPRDAAEVKYEFLAARLANPAIAPVVRTALEADLATSRAAFDANDAAGAIAAMNAFSARVTAASPTEIPDRWRAARDLDNIAGDLLGEAAALRFLLGRL